MIGRRASLLVGIGLMVAVTAIASSTASAATYRIALLPQSIPAGGQATILATINASGPASGRSTSRHPRAMASRGSGCPAARQAASSATSFACAGSGSLPAVRRS